MAIGIVMGVMMLACLGGHLLMHKKHAGHQAPPAVQVSTTTVHGSTGAPMNGFGDEHHH